MVLSIADHSLDFWNENENAIGIIRNAVNNNDDQVTTPFFIWGIIAAIAADDAIGGMAGILVGEIYQHVTTGEGSVSEKQVKERFITGAITGSILP